MKSASSNHDSPFLILQGEKKKREKEVKTKNLLDIEMRYNDETPSRRPESSRGGRGGQGGRGGRGRGGGGYNGSRGGFVNVNDKNAFPSLSA